MNNEYRMLNNEVLRLTSLFNIHYSTFDILHSMP